MIWGRIFPTGYKICTNCNRKQKVIFGDNKMDLIAIDPIKQRP